MPFYSSLTSMLLSIFISCTDDPKNFVSIPTNDLKILPVKDIRGIPIPAGFKIVEKGDSGFSKWLLDLKFRPDRTVYLYNGAPRSDQHNQFGVLDLDIGNRDLVQCADAAIKLRADYLYKKKRYDQLRFIATSGDEITFEKWSKGTRWKERSGRLVEYTANNGSGATVQSYALFMDIVFAYCGTWSIRNQMQTVTAINTIQAGDVFVEGGFPGHAVTVMAVAEGEKGKKIFLLSQGYMPAQDIHVLKNYANLGLSPWYALDEVYPLFTPQWQFGTGTLRRW